MAYSIKNSVEIERFYRKQQVSGLKPADFRFYPLNSRADSLLRPLYFKCVLVESAGQRFLALASTQPGSEGYLILGSEGPEIEKLRPFPGTIRLGPVKANLDPGIAEESSVLYAKAVEKLAKSSLLQDLKIKAKQCDPLPIYPLNLKVPNLIRWENKRIIKSHAGPLFDFFCGENLELVPQLIRYENLSSLDALIVSGKLCKRCKKKLRERFNLPSTSEKLPATSCVYCTRIDPEWQQRQSFSTFALMSPEIFEKFLSYDSFFGNYLAKRYADMQRQKHFKKEAPDDREDGISNRKWDPYFERLLKNIMNHPNDLRVQEYFHQIRRLPLDTPVSDETVDSPYYRSKYNTVYEEKSSGDFEKTSEPLWQARIIKRRYSADNYPIYPSSNIYWVKRIHKPKEHFQVLNLYPPKDLGVPVMTFKITPSQFYQMFNTTESPPISQKNLDNLWKNTRNLMQVEL